MSIKNKIIRNFLIVVLSSIVILNTLLIFFVRDYYYSNTENILSNQIDIATKFYDKYYSNTSLLINVYDNVDSFWNQSNVQVELFNEDGKLIMDSIGINSQDYEVKEQVKKALNGESVKWIGKVSYFSHKVMSLTKGIVLDGKTIGAIRFVTSLELIDKSILTIIGFYISISFLVLGLAVVLSFIMAKNIVNPILKLKDRAEKMAAGDLTERCTVDSSDEIGQLSNTLDYMAGELNKRENLKNEFISSVSHELRTPLTAIKGWAITLNNEETDKETLKLGFDIIEKETDRLSGLVEDLLDFSRLINNKITLKKVNVNIGKLSSYIYNYMNPRAKKENKELTVQNLTNNLVISMDINRFKQVIINILDNSFKFTSEGGKINIIFSENDKNLIIKVSDNGCGIPKDELPRVCEKFFKGSNVNSNAGIGLSIANEIIKLHNGELFIYSELNIGTEISIVLPKMLGDDD